MIAVSACLLGICCRYDGGCAVNHELNELYAKGLAVPVCPECEGGLPTPRTPAEIVGGSGEDVLDGNASVVTSDGRDVTAEYVLGAERILAKLGELGIDRCVLKSRSPSCGAGTIYDGSFSGKTVSGNGVAAALFKRNGIRVECGDASREVNTSGA